MNKKFAIVLALSLIAIVCCAGCIDPQDQVDPVDPVVPVDPVDPVTPPVDPVVPAVEYSVFFMLNYDGAGAYTAETVTAGDAVSKPATPTRSGYTFKGWFTAAEGGAEYDFTQAVNADVTLYAQWSKKSSSGSGHSHSYTTLVETVEATCGTDGHNVYKCSCGQTKTETIPATGQHSSVKLSGGIVVCAVCETHLVAQIGSNYYTTFASAMTEATESDTITLLAAVIDGEVNKKVVIDTNNNETTLKYDAGLTVADIKIVCSTASNLGTVKLGDEEVVFEVDTNGDYVESSGYLVVAYTKKGTIYTVYRDYGLKQALTAEDANIVVNLAKDDLTYDVAAWQNNAMGGDTTETITINGNDNTLLFNLCDSDWTHVTTVNNDAKLILNNMDLGRIGYNSGHWKRLAIHFNCSVEMNSVSAESVGFENDAILKDLHLTSSNDLYSLWIHANGQTVELIDSKINSGRGIKIADEDADGGLVTLKVSNSEFITSSKAAILVTSIHGANIQINGIDIDSVAADSTNAVWVDEDRAAYYDKVKVTGCTKVHEDIQSVTETASDQSSFVTAAGSVVSGGVIELSTAGEYVLPNALAGKEVVISGTEDTKIDVTSGLSYANGATVRFDGVTIKSEPEIAGYTNGFADFKYAIFNNCVIEGTLGLDFSCEFNDCTFNVEGNYYNVWTWGAGTVTFKDCTFNCDGKALLVYANVLDNGNYHQTVNINACTFNDKGDNTVTGKAAIEITNTYTPIRTYDVFITNTEVNGFTQTVPGSGDFNANYGSVEGSDIGNNVWGNKCKLPNTQINVVIDGVDVY